MKPSGKADGAQDYGLLRQRPLWDLPLSRRQVALTSDLTAVFTLGFFARKAPPEANALGGDDQKPRANSKREKQGWSRRGGTTHATYDGAHAHAESRMRGGSSCRPRRPGGVSMAAERKTKLSKNLLRMKVRGREGGGSGGGDTQSFRPG